MVLFRRYIVTPLVKRMSCLCEPLPQELVQEPGSQTSRPLVGVPLPMYCNFDLHSTCSFFFASSFVKSASK